MKKDFLIQTRSLLAKWTQGCFCRPRKLFKLFLLPAALFKAAFLREANEKKTEAIMTAPAEKEVQILSEQIKTVNFKTFSMLNGCIYKNINKIPEDVDLIVGVPRSGLLVANLLAVYLHLQLTDIDGLLNDRIFSNGISCDKTRNLNSVSESRKILVVDDSVNFGTTMEEIRARLKDFPFQDRIIYCGVYVTEEACSKVDLYFEICNQPRMFEWNMMRHGLLSKCCVDVDGVLCRDPSDEENDDGPKYIEFLKEAPVLFKPGSTIGHLVTCRLEKYRSVTEEWLQRHGIKYDQLEMMQYNSKEERMRANRYAAYKGEYYKNTDTILFLESSLRQAKEIASIANKPVFCFENQQTFP